MHDQVQIGNATLILGDCLEVLPTLQKVDCVITDPPYGISAGHGFGGGACDARGRKKGGGKRIPLTDYVTGDWDNKPASDDRIAACISAGKRCIIWGGNYFTVPPNAKWLVWDKLNSGDFADCELAWTNLPGAVRIFRHMWNGMIRASERDVSRVHPTQKPIALMKWCIEQAGNPMIILDPFMGSGSAGVAAVQMGHKFIGVELDERYFRIACERIETAQRQLSLLDPMDDYDRVEYAERQLGLSL